MTRTITKIAILCAFALMLGACAKSTSQQPASPGAASAAPATDGPVTIATTEYAFEIPPISAGTHEVVLQNDGEQVHMAAIVQLLDGKTVDDALAYIEEHGAEGKEPSWVKTVGFGIVEPGGTAPVGPGEGDPQPGAELDFVAGDYMALCFIADGTTSMDPDQAPPKGAQSHAELGMVQGFTVA